MQSLPRQQIYYYQKARLSQQQIDTEQTNAIHEHERALHKMTEHCDLNTEIATANHEDIKKIISKLAEMTHQASEQIKEMNKRHDQLNKRLEILELFAKPRASASLHAVDFI